MGEVTTVRLDRFQDRLDFGNVLFALFILAFTRQYTWPFENQILAWTLAVLLAAVIWYCYVTLAPQPREKLPRPFWLVVALPLLFVYLLRVVEPDTSFDVLNYHIFQAERSLRGSLYAPGDFFQNTPFNPAPDMLTGIYRHLFGYRLGTAVNYLAVLWTGGILYRLLRDYFGSPLLRCAAVLFILLTEQILFQINNYMVDLLALPLLLEATRLAIEPEDAASEARPSGRATAAAIQKRSTTARTLCIALLLGISAAFKLSNLAFGIPIILVFLFNSFARLKPSERTVQAFRLLKTLPVATLVFLAPLAPFAISSYELTGSPVFPFFNGIFHSPYWPEGKFFDPRWGPYGLRETLLWPILIFFKPERMSEIAVYSGRISIGFILAAICFIFVRSKLSIRELSFITLLGAFLWSAGTGYSRYAIYLELTGGVILVWFVAYVWKQCVRLPVGPKLLIQIPLWTALLVQTGLALDYANRYEWSMRGTIFKHPANFLLNESREFLQDRSLLAYLSPADRALLDDVDVWIETTDKTSALEVFLKLYTPVLGVRSPPFFVTEQSRSKFDEAVRANQGKRLFTLTNASDLQEVQRSLVARGLVAGRTQNISIPYFSQSKKLDMLLIEVLPGSQTAAKGLPLPDRAFKAQLSVSDLPASMRAGQKYLVRVALKNESPVTWPGRQPAWQYQITLGDRWLNESGVTINELDGRVALDDDLAPGESVALSLQVTAPPAAGNYILQFDAIQEGVAWFSEKGSAALNLRIKVD